MLSTDKRSSLFCRNVVDDDAKMSPGESVGRHGRRYFSNNRRPTKDDPIKAGPNPFYILSGWERGVRINYSQNVTTGNTKGKAQYG
jgi:hypothetical protein